MRDISKLKYLYSRFILLKDSIVDACLVGNFERAIYLAWNTPDKHVQYLIFTAANVVDLNTLVKTYEYSSPLDVLEAAIRAGAGVSLPDLYDLIGITHLKPVCNCGHRDYDHQWWDESTRKLMHTCSSFYCLCNNFDANTKQPCNCPIKLVMQHGCKNSNHC